MLSEKVQKILTKCNNCKLNECIGCDITYTEINQITEYIEQLEATAKELGKGQQTLMQSRRKWKNRYYKEKQRKEKSKPDWKDLSDKCSDIAEEAKFTKEDTDRIVKETREMQAKAKKYDILVEKIKDKIEDLGISDVDIYLQCELQELLKEVEDA